MLPEVEIEPLAILRERFEEGLRSAIELSPNLLAALCFLAFTWAVAAIAKLSVGKILKYRRARPALLDAVKTIVAVIVWSIGILLAATIALPGLSPSEALAGIGIGSIAIGLAFRDIFENFLAGLLILLRKPMRIGDYVICEDVEGHVERITIRDTYLRRTDGVLVMVPNAFIYKHPVEVLTDRTLRRQEIIVGVAYGENVDEARSVIEGSLSKLETIEDSRPIQVFAKNFGSSSIDFEVAWWTKSAPVDIRRSRDEVVAAIKSALDAAGIEIPFPYRTLVFKDRVGVHLKGSETEQN